MRQFLKTKKKLTYLIAVTFGSVATFFMISKDNHQDNSTATDYRIINKASADLPYSQNSYYAQANYLGDGGLGDDSRSDDAGADSYGDDGDFGPDASDEAF